MPGKVPIVNLHFSQIEKCSSWASSSRFSKAACTPLSWSGPRRWPWRPTTAWNNWHPIPVPPTIIIIYRPAPDLLIPLLKKSPSPTDTFSQRLWSRSWSALRFFACWPRLFVRKTLWGQFFKSIFYWNWFEFSSYFGLTYWFLEKLV